MTGKQRLDRHDKQIAAIRNVIHEGMRLVVETSKDMRAFAAAQEKTGQSLKSLIDATRGGGKGQSKRRVDLQQPPLPPVADELRFQLLHCGGILRIGGQVAHL